MPSSREIIKLTYLYSNSNFLYASIIFLTRGCLTTSFEENRVIPIPSSFLQNMNNMIKA